MNWVLRSPERLQQMGVGRAWPKPFRIATSAPAMQISEVSAASEVDVTSGELEPSAVVI